MRIPAVAAAASSLAVIMGVVLGVPGGLVASMLASMLLASVLLGMGLGERRSEASLMYRVKAPINAGIQDVQEDMDRLSRFAVERSKEGFSYIVASLSTHGRRGAYIVITGRGGGVEREGELLEAFGKSLKTIRLERLPNASWGRRVLLPLPEGAMPVLPPTYVQRSLERMYPRVSLGGVEEPSILLGYAVNSDEPLPIGLEPEDLFRHVAVFGSTGSGKTTTAARIALEAAKTGLSVIIIDWHDEYHRLLREAGVLKPCGRDSELAVDPFGDEASIEESVDIVEQVLGLSPPQTYMLHRVLEEHGGGMGIEELLSFLEADASTQGYWEREVRQALIRRLHPLLRGSRIGVFRRGSRGVGRLLNHDLSIIQVGCIENLSLRRLYALFLLKLLFMEAGDSGRGIVVVVDEAHNVFGDTQGGNSFTDKLVAESRKYMLGFVIVTQSPSSIMEGVLKNTSTKIIHSIRSGMDKKVVASSLALSREYIDLLGYLRPGEAVVQTPLIPQPVVARIIPPSGIGVREPRHHTSRSSQRIRGMAPHHL